MDKKPTVTTAPKAALTIKPRPLGAVAQVGRMGHPVVTSRTGGELDVVTGAAAVGFNPLDLMFASLAACLVLSCRVAASRLGLLDRLVTSVADVSGDKTGEEPYRLVRFVVNLTIEGDFLDEERAEIAHRAEDICTVSNTLKRSAEIVVYLR